MQSRISGPLVKSVPAPSLFPIDLLIMGATALVWRSFLFQLGVVGLSQPYARSSAVFVDELDGLTEDRPQCLESCSDEDQSPSGGLFVPELTRSASIQLNKRVSLPALRETLILLAVVRDWPTPHTSRPTRAIRGRRLCPAAAPPEGGHNSELLDKSSSTLAIARRYRAFASGSLHGCQLSIVIGVSRHQSERGRPALLSRSQYP
jgi:hypothetical protein